MNVVIKYDNSQYITIQTISVIGSFNGFDASKGVMNKEGNVWVFKANLPPGEYRYKLLINNELRLNDPYANVYEPDDQDELWSLIMINKQGMRLYNNNEYAVHIEDYKLSNVLTESDRLESKKNFSIDMDKQIVARFQFTDISGLHAVTVAWYTPQGELFQSAENALFSPENQEMVTLWFWMDVQETDKTNAIGVWTMRLFIDGEYVLEDNFVIGKSGIYTSQGQYVNI